MTSLTILQRPSGDDFAKARELIEIRGTGELSLQDRRVMNVLYANAGQRLCDDVFHAISIAELRGNHKGSERIRDSILRLMKTVVQVPVTGRNGKAATKRVQVLSDTTTSDDEDDPTGQVIYSFSKGMREIIKDSTLWGRVRTAVVFAFTSKYSLALYELITARINLKHIWQEEFTLEDFRALLGVPNDKLSRDARSAAKGHPASGDRGQRAGGFRREDRADTNRGNHAGLGDGLPCLLVAQGHPCPARGVPGNQPIEGGTNRAPDPENLRNRGRREDPRRE